MAYLLDTNILMRLANPDDDLHAPVKRSLISLVRLGEEICITPQNLIEFRSASTRPVNVNGLGYSAAEADTLIEDFELAFTMLEDVPAIFQNWKSIVQSIGVLGKQVHDARLIAVGIAHNISHLLTLNLSHFTRIASATPQIHIVDPASI